MMIGKVLVLNQDYNPLMLCTVHRAFLLVFLNKAQLLEADQSEFLHSVSTTFEKPTVIRINEYIHVPFRGVALTRQNVFKRDGNQCQYCGGHQYLTLDHLIPRSKGGKSTWKNLVTACQNCNSKKGSRSLKESGFSLKKPPSRPSYVMFLRDTFGNMRKEWLPYLSPHAVA